MSNNDTKRTRVLLLGSGGREHALALALKKSDIDLINWSPQINPGIAKIAYKCYEKPFEKRVHIPGLDDVKYAIIGPEAPLVEGIGDCLDDKHTKMKVFGPNAKNARIEGDKIYMRQLLSRYDIPGNVRFEVASTHEELREALDRDFQVAVKPKGLTGGKGVKVWGSHLKTKEMVYEYAHELIDKDGVVLLEQLITGIEFSVQAIVKGERMIFLPLVKDYKRAYENDVGPNTGSMGSCSFADHGLPYINDEDLRQVKEIMRETIKALNEENGEYHGFLYGQFMLSKTGVKVIEFNARLGDPEAINVLGLLDTPLLDIIDALYEKKEIDVKVKPEASVCVYIVPKGYPENPEEGAELNLQPKLLENAIFANIKEKDGKFFAGKSRSLAVIAYGENLEIAMEKAYKLMPKQQDKFRYRCDIAKEFLLESQ
ncbi:MAG: phosphoribosylamine--glycine ligase [Candidatus Heimdallarchaeota archaeon]|nr:phosphoribosylamine--glycine ligase [Candidatus Heimdallarchaeota archaeon]